MSTVSLTSGSSTRSNALEVAAASRRQEGLDHLSPFPSGRRRPLGRLYLLPARPALDLYEQRDTAEHCINRIKEWRGMAFRFDKTPRSHLAGLHVRGAVLWMGSLQPI
ncbi:hypothetical protein ACIBP6_15450 [Nonomuraea terrae]|uniref:hypothetical protein n=1 Tax=Nonomuraea terrae TaxID=2530383 RepID=UPI0037A7A723